MSPACAGNSAAITDALAWIGRHSPVDVRCEHGASGAVGAELRRRGARHALVVTDPGVRAAGHVQRVLDAMAAERIRTTVFDDVAENPHTGHVARGLAIAAAAAAQGPTVDWIVAIGGGSAMDCAKGINLLLTNGGQVRDYWGINKPTEPLLPSVLIPTTAGTGSEAQSFALISDEQSHVKMACGDRRPPAEGGLRPRLAILDDALTATVPASVAAAVGIDALTHAIETAGSTAADDTSRQASGRAWSLLSASFAESLRNPHNAEARRSMLIGAHLAGIAIELSMLGAAHACANPLTATYGITHGVAVGLMLPAVIRFNAADGVNPYAVLGEASDLAESVESAVRKAGLPRRLAELDVEESRLPALAESAAQQWTAKFNPRPVSAAELLSIYRAAF